MNTNKKDKMKQENESNGGVRPELATAICSVAWISAETPPESMGWYLGNFNGAVRCIGYDKEGWGFWGVPCDELPEYLTHWMPIPSLPNDQDDPHPPENAL